MKIILKEDVSGLGYKDDVVEVKSGYGRNYLIPFGKAVIATPSLFVEEFFEEFRVFVVDEVDAEFLKAAVFFLFYVYRHRSEVAYFGLLCH